MKKPSILCLLVSALNLMLLSGCSNFASQNEDISIFTKKAVQISKYGLVGLPRDLMDLPFSCIVALDQSIYFVFDEKDPVTPSLIGGIAGWANWISHSRNHSWEYLFGNQYAYSGLAAGFIGYIGWAYVGHPIEVFIFRYPYDDRWWLVGNPDPDRKNWWQPGHRLKNGKEIRKLFFPNYQGMLGR